MIFVLASSTLYEVYISENAVYVFARVCERKRKREENLGYSKHATWISRHKPTKSPSRNYPSLWQGPESKNRNSWSKNSHWHKWFIPKSKMPINFISNYRNSKLFCSFCDLSAIQNNRLQRYPVPITKTGLLVYNLLFWCHTNTIDH